MRFNCLRGISVLALGTMLSTVGFAHNTSAHLEYNVGFSHNDNGFMKMEGFTPPSSTKSHYRSYLDVAGEAGKATMSVRYDLWKNATDVAKVDFALCETMSVSAGRMYVNQGGYDNKNWNAAQHLTSHYTKSHMPFDRSATALQANYSLGGNLGRVSVQFHDDVVQKKDKDGKVLWAYGNTSNTQPNWGLEWSGSSFGPATPLVQFLPYDMGRSMHLALGAGFEMGEISGTFGFVMDNRGAKMGKDVKATSYSNISLDVNYKMADMVPFFGLRMFSATQPEKDVPGNAKVGTFEDNAMDMIVGMNYTKFGTAFVPYFSLTMNNANFLDPTDPSKAEGKSAMAISFGATGSI